MTRRSARLAVLLGLLLAPTWALAADDSIDSAYAAILRGDYETGRATIDRLAREGDATATRVRDWLTSYHEVIDSRNELKRKTFDWCIEMAKKSIDDQKIYRAVNFVAQAVPYVKDPSELRSYPWVTDLTQQAKKAAAEFEAQEKWKSALSYYMLLGRIYPDDEWLESAIESATRHARIEVSYKDEKALKERIQSVQPRLLTRSIRSVNESYYKDPDFKVMARGALDNLLVLANVKKMQNYLHGLGNATLREMFIQKLTALRDEVDSATTFEEKDLQRLFNRVAEANKVTVELPEGLLVVEFTEGATGELDDYTGVIWPADAADFDKMMMGTFFGVGIQLGVDERTNRLKVITPLDASPALEAGIEPDDLIVAVNGETTAGWSTDDAVRNIMGKDGTEVVLTIARPRTGEELAFKLTRREVTLHTVKGMKRTTDGWEYMLDPETGVGYVRLTGFHQESARELAEAINRAKAEGMKGLVLDIRHNPGGLLDVVVDIVSLFVERGEVVSTRGRQEGERRPVSGKAPFKDLPVVVLINEGSASASEILAGALQDHHRAVVLGDRSFGKGSVQHVKPLQPSARIGGDDDAAKVARLKLTTALYYLPSGRTPHKSKPKCDRWGVDPDWEVKLTPKEFRRVIERERDANVIHKEKSATNKPLSDEERAAMLEKIKAAEKQEDEEEPLLTEDDLKLLEADPVEAPNADPQLETALLIMRVKLAANIPWPRDIAAALRDDRK